MEVQFKKTCDIFYALLKGTKIRFRTWGPGEFVYLEDGQIKHQYSENEVETDRYEFIHPEKWFVYIPPKVPKKRWLTNKQVLKAFNCKQQLYIDVPELEYAWQVEHTYYGLMALDHAIEVGNKIYVLEE